jgi:Transposase DDE domain
MTPTSKPVGRRRKGATNNPDHARRTHVPAPADRDIEQRLTELVKPAVFAELEYYRKLGLRSRLLSLPVMVALVLAMLWRRVPGVCTLQRMLARERILWAQPTHVSQPALSERFLTFPAVLFERVLYRVLSRLPDRLATRSRPLPPLLQTLRTRFAAAYAVDGTTLEALFRKLKVLREVAQAPFAGQLGVVCDLFSHLPSKVWYAQDPATNDKAFLPQLLDWLPTNSLLVFDLGYFAFTFFDALTTAGSWFVCRLREKTSFTVQQVLVNRAHVRDRVVQLGKYRATPSVHAVRLIEVYVNGAWRQYLTNVLDPQRLSIVEVVELYEYRWTIESAFLLVKRLLDLAYVWVGSHNGVQLQVWATWLYYAVLIDLCDEVAEVLQLPLERISVEMVARSLYFYVQAVDTGYSGSAATYLAREAKELGIIKRLRPPSGPTVREQIRLALVAPPLPAGP